MFISKGEGWVLLSHMGANQGYRSFLIGPPEQGLRTRGDDQ